jgi:hypothetical protein
MSQPMGFCPIKLCADGSSDFGEMLHMLHTNSTVQTSNTVYVRATRILYLQDGGGGEGEGGSALACANPLKVIWIWCHDKPIRSQARDMILISNGIPSTNLSTPSSRISHSVTFIASVGPANDMAWSLVQMAYQKRHALFPRSFHDRAQTGLNLLLRSIRQADICWSHLTQCTIHTPS